MMTFYVPRLARHAIRLHIVSTHETSGSTFIIIIAACGSSLAHFAGEMALPNATREVKSIDDSNQLKRQWLGELHKAGIPPDRIER